MGGTYSISTDPPSGFDEKYEATLQMKYARITNGYAFDYKAKKIIPKGFTPPVERTPSQEWTRFLVGNVVVAELDIGIDYGDTTIVVETVDDGQNKDLFWNSNAIMTEEPRTDLYGELRYWNGTDWVPSPPAKCRKMRFRARLNPVKEDNVHTFSFHVLVPDASGFPSPLEVDPDIKNPSV